MDKGCLALISLARRLIITFSNLFDSIFPLTLIRLSLMHTKRQHRHRQQCIGLQGRTINSQTDNWKLNNAELQ